ncbi:MAG: hypothetical protein IKD77_00680 [Bacilli bacterium]|nr:hypothetical protein [Bacilli bacterium]
MAKNKKKTVFVLLCIVVLIFGGYKIFNKKSSNPLSTETIVSNVKNEKVGMPYINPEWTEYMKLSEEDKANTNAPQMYIYNYIPEEDMYDDYSSLPSSFNLRDEYPTVLYNQGSEGLCWAYATVEMLESNLKITKGIDVQFSVDQLDLLTMSDKYYKYKYNPYSLERRRGEGLSFGDSYEYENLIMSSGVMPVEKNKFPVDKYDDSIDYYNIDDVADTSNVEYSIVNTVNFPVYENTKEYRDMMKSFIKNYGAIYIDTTADFKNQIIDYQDGRFDKLLGHAMVIVGWDDEYAGGAWILQNSWNETDFDQYYIKYSSKIFELYGVKEIISKDWDNCYNISSSPNIEYKGISLHQDPSMVNSVSGRIKGEINDIRESNAISGSVIASYNKPTFRKEKLKMINFVSASQNSVYKIYISDSGNKDDFTYIKEISTDMPGLYTVYFDDIDINNGEFSIKVESENGAMYPIINAFSSTNSVEDAEKNISSHVDGGSFNVDGNYEYHIISDVANIDNGERIWYTIGKSKFDTTAQRIQGIVNNGQSICTVEFPRKTSLYTKLYVEVEYDGEIIENFEFEYVPKTNFENIEGLGTEENPYIITNEKQLSLISSSPSAYYVLGNDIDLTFNSDNDITFNRGVGWKPLDTFCGTLDGRGFSIKNMSIYSRIDDEATLDKNIGLFSNIDGAIIKNLKITDVRIENGDTKHYNIGCLAGEATDSNIYNVMVSGSIDCKNSNCVDTSIGMLIGSIGNSNANVELNKISCVGNITSKITEAVGGVIGKSEVGIEGKDLLVVTEISNSYASSYVGGVLGEGKLISVENSFIIPKFNVADSCKLDILYAEFDKYNIEKICNIATINSLTYGESINNYQTQENDNIITEKNEYKLRKISIDKLRFDSSIWEYLPDNPYPTLKGQEYHFITIEPYEIKKYTVDEDKKTIGNIFPTTIEHYRENMAIEDPYTVKIYKKKTENETEVEEEVTEGNIATGMITKIYLNDEVVAEYTNIVPGDVFADGKVNSRDAGMTQQYLIGMLDNLYGTPQYYAMDFTRDGKVRLNDVELIMRYTVRMYEPSEEDYYGENN